MKYFELDDEEKEKAIATNYDVAVVEGWHESILESWKDKLAVQGFYGVKNIYCTGLDGNGDVYFESDFSIYDFMKHYGICNKYRKFYDNYLRENLYFTGWVSISRETSKFGFEWSVSNNDSKAEHERLKGQVENIVDEVREKLIDVCSDIKFELDKEHTYLTSKENVEYVLSSLYYDFDSQGNIL